jgi:hypothetical protein
MARLLPSLSDERIFGIESSGEQQFYKWCRDYLPDTITVFHSVSWVEQDRHVGLRDGEADFVLCDEERGVLCVEVKGGRIAFNPDSGVWTTTDRNGVVTRLKRSPLAQAKDSKHRLIRLMQGDPRWQSTFKNGRPPFAHAAFFPSLTDLRGLVGIDSPIEILGGRNEGGAALRPWVRHVFDYAAGDNRRALGPAGCSLLKHKLFPRIDVKPMMTTTLDDAELKRIELSREQSAVLDVLSRRNRALITGGAGTGKTLIAVEKVRRLAVGGSKTLLVCFNDALAQSLARALANLPNASAHTFHSLCGQILATVRRESGRDLLAEVQAEHSDWDLYNQVIPEAASRASDLTDLQFDAIVVDEAQDFRDTYWLPLELLLRGGSQGTLYIFYDSNQQIYAESLHLPIAEQPYLLSRNCRNAEPIHEVAYEYYSGDPTTASNIPGRVEIIAAATLQQGAKTIVNTISELLLSEQVSSERIVVLIAGVPKLDYIEALEKRKLPGGYSWRFAGAETEDKSRFIAVDTVQHFKGLESDVAFVWGIESAAGCDRPELLYIGFSRAKTMLFVVGSLQKHRE